MYSPLYERNAYSSFNTRPFERSLFEILVSLLMAAILGAITFVPLAAAGTSWSFL